MKILKVFDKPELYEHYKYLIGNLTLLEKLNQTLSVSNGLFEAKKSGY